MKVNYSPTTQHKIEPRLYKLLIAIMDETIKPEEELPNKEFVDYAISEIKAVSDLRGTPIFRIENKFFIYDEDEQIHVPNKAMEEFLGWVSKHLGMPENIAYHIPFRNAMFGCAWRVLKQ